MKMKMIIQDQVIYNEAGVAIGVLTDMATREDIRVIEFGSEAADMLKELQMEMTSRDFKRAVAVRSIEKLVNKYS